MDYSEFRELANLERDARAELEDEEFKLFESRTASVADLRSAEAEVGVEFPSDYRLFMEEFGGGRFLFVEMLPLRTGAEFEESVVSATLTWGDDRFVAIAAVGTGDYWGFPVKDGRCVDTIVMACHGEDGFLEESDSFLDFVVSRGLRRSVT